VAIEGLEDGAVAAGLSRAAARRVVRQAALAAVAVAPDDHSASDTEPERAAMKLVEQRGVRPAFRRAVGAAVERCRQIREERKEELDDRRSPC
jgi:pyrroline-5-carboxylate reductase